ncbi:MAG: L-threonylcarbamoyladenylate synthase [Thermoprotei archaeon]|nr:L-threonylcarbamoyladenylate synthase [Thermoprotei archaeon]
MDTRVFKVDPVRPERDIVEYAAGVIRAGGLVAFPTETVYGLGADALNASAVARIYEVKGRPLDNPVIVHISDFNQLDIVASRVPEEAYRLAEKLWPGPLTLLLPRNIKVPRKVTAGLETVAVRMPAHPVALELIRASKNPIAAPSANISGKPSPTRGDHVVRDLYSKVEVILDGGETLYGVESTIINILTDPPKLLRPGAYPVEVIEEILGRRIEVPDFARGLGEAPQALAPGMKHRHYAPNTELILVESIRGDFDAVRGAVTGEAEKLAGKGLKVAIISFKEHSSFYKGVKAQILELGSRENMFEIARNLFHTLRVLDTLNVDAAIVECVEERGLGLAIMNRLRKASSKRIVLP